MAHGGYGDRRVAGRKPKPAGGGRRSKGPGVDNKGKAKKPKSVSLKNQIRSTERYLRKDLPPEVKDAQEKKLQDLKKEQETINRLAVERKIFLRDRKIKFFERRKVERAIRRLEKAQRASSGQSQESETSAELSKLKEDLEYVRFFPKTEKYVSLFIGGDDADIVDKRNKLRKQIKSNIIAAAASGKDLEETGSEDDGLLDISEDDFFLTRSSSDEEDADDEWTDKSTREQASSASGKATSGMSSDERNQRHISDRALMPPPRPSSKSFPNSTNFKPRFGGSTSKKQPFRRTEVSSSSTSYGASESSFRNRQSSDSSFRNRQSSDSSFRNNQSSESSMGHSSNLSSNSDAHKPKRKRRPKKKKAQA